MKAIRVHAPGGLEALQLDEVLVPTPKPGEALVRLAAAGVNFIDVYQRTGFYPLPTPFTLGQEAAGTVEAVGDGVTLARPGERVAWTGVMGSYAEYAVAPAERLVSVPDGVTLEQAAAVLLQGMTAHYLATTTFPLQAGRTCVVHAAAGGVGLLLCRIAKLRGARVIGTTSTEEKAQLARQAGADDVVLYSTNDLAADVKRLTGGRGVDVVYDSVGRTTWEASLRSLAPRGMLVLFGQSSGAVPPVDPLLLSRSGSLFLTRPMLAHYTATREELLARARDVLGWVREGRLTVRVHRSYPLADAAAAHRDLESRRTAGKLLLVPG
jgi:NADPH2:quinone reductase